VQLTWLWILFQALIPLFEEILKWIDPTFAVLLFIYESVCNVFAGNYAAIPTHFLHFSFSYVAAREQWFGTESLGWSLHWLASKLFGTLRPVYHRRGLLRASILHYTYNTIVARMAMNNRTEQTVGSLWGMIVGACVVVNFVVMALSKIEADWWNLPFGARIDGTLFVTLLFLIFGYSWCCAKLRLQGQLNVVVSTLKALGIKHRRKSISLGFSLLLLGVMASKYPKLNSVPVSSQARSHSETKRNQVPRGPVATKATAKNATFKGAPNAKARNATFLSPRVQANLNRLPRKLGLARQTIGKGAGIVMPETNQVRTLGFNTAQISTNAANQGGPAPEQVAASQNHEYSFSVLQPKTAKDSGMMPKVPDQTLQPTSGTGSVNSVSIGTLTNAHTGAHEALAFATPVFIDYTCNTFLTTLSPGGPETMMTKVDPTVAVLDQAALACRQVACVGMARNLTNVSGQAGEAILGICPAYLLNNATGTAVDGLATFDELVSGGQHMKRTNNNPGDIGMSTWYPTSTHYEYNENNNLELPSSLDNMWLFAPDIITFGVDLVNAAPDTTVNYHWFRTDTSHDQNEEVEFHRLIEYIPYPLIAPLANPTFSLGSLEKVRWELTDALQRMPKNSIGRCVWRDDGVAPALISDIKTVWNTGKRIIGGISDIAGSIGGALSSLFSTRLRTLAALQQLAKNKDSSQEEKAIVATAMRAIQLQMGDLFEEHKTLGFRPFPMRRLLNSGKHNRLALKYGFTVAVEEPEEKSVVSVKRAK
jgi:hypothetical protein